MAACVKVGETPRLGESLAGKHLANLPVIEHPMSRLDRRGLSIRGQSRGGSTVQEHSFGTVEEGGQVRRGGGDQANLPRLSTAELRDWTGRSLAQEADGPGTGGRVTSRILATPEYCQKKESRRDGEITSKWCRPTLELEYMIQEKLTSGYHGLRHLFKANDPTGQGVVSREALLKIIYTICGYVTQDQFNKLLKGIGFNGKTNISFDDFVTCFKENDKSRKVWLSPTQRVEINKVLRTGGAHLQGWSHLSLLLLHPAQDKARAGQYCVQEVLPESCFEIGGLVIQPQLLDMTQRLGYKLSEDEFTKLWNRYDTSGNGAVRTSNFLKYLGLDENGNARPATTTCQKVLPVSQTISKTRTATEGHSKMRQDEKTIPGPREEPARKKRTTKINKLVPKLERVVDCLHYMFEQPYNALLQGMQCFDFLKDGFIARIDFKKVFEQYGLPVTVLDMDYFFSRCGVRSIHGQIAYKDFLLKFWNKAEGSMVSRVVSNAFHMFASDRLPLMERGRCLSVEELEARLVEYLHGDFLSLLGNLKKCDKDNLGVVTGDEFRAAVGHTLGYAMSDKQWAELKEKVGLDKDGLVPCATFMETFSKPPGQWNKRQVGLFPVAQVQKMAPPLQAVRLQAEADALLGEIQAEVAVEQEQYDKGMRRSKGMDTAELTQAIQHFFKFKFHSFDKVFKSIDRRMTGRFNVHQFAMILKQCGLVLLPSEVECLWESLPVAPDNMLSFSALMRHINTLNKGPPIIKDKLPMEYENVRVNSEDISGMGEDTSELVGKARTVQQERKAQKLREDHLSLKQPVKAEATRVTGKEECEQLLERLRSEVVHHWEKFKEIFRHLDPAGSSAIKVTDMKDVLKMLRLSLSEIEVELVLNRFNLDSNGLFNYMEFLKHYTKHRSDATTAITETIPQKLQQKRSKWGPELTEVMGQMKGKDWKQVRRTFRKMDTSNHGYLNVDEFQSGLASCDVTISDEDLYHILSEFDPNMNGKISYEHFLGEILRTAYV